MSASQAAQSRTIGRRWARPLLLSYTLGMLLFVYVPPTYLLLISFNPGLLPHLPSLSHLSLKWYWALFSEERMIAAFKASVLTGITTALITTVLAILTSLAYLRTVNRSLLFNTVVFPMFVPGVLSRRRAGPAPHLHVRRHERRDVADYLRAGRHHSNGVLRGNRRRSAGTIRPPAPCRLTNSSAGGDGLEGR